MKYHGWRDPNLIRGFYEVCERLGIRTDPIYTAWRLKLRLEALNRLQLIQAI